MKIEDEFTSLFNQCFYFYRINWIIYMSLLLTLRFKKNFFDVEILLALDIYNLFQFQRSSAFRRLLEILISKQSKNNDSNKFKYFFAKSNFIRNELNIINDINQNSINFNDQYKKIILIKKTIEKMWLHYWASDFKGCKFENSSDNLNFLDENNNLFSKIFTTKNFCKINDIEHSKIFNQNLFLSENNCFLDKIIKTKKEIFDDFYMTLDPELDSLYTIQSNDFEIQITNEMNLKIQFKDKKKPCLSFKANKIWKNIFQNSVNFENSKYQKDIDENYSDLIKRFSK